MAITCPHLPLCCPNCGARLTAAADGARFFCKNGHSFDAARQGYVNFLLPNHGGARAPGDDRDMVLARRRFLATGAYQPFSDAVNAAVRDALSNCGARAVIADAGCGEGYYTARLSRALSAWEIPHAVCGFDLSKSAAAAAAIDARDGGLPIQYGVASLFAMPMADDSCDAILNLFAPCAAEEFARVLHDGGLLVMAVPGARHLFECKALLYDTPYENVPRRDVLPGFSAPQVVPVTTTFSLGAEKDDLLRMTPYFFHTPRAGFARFAAAEIPFPCTASFDLLLYRKTGQSV